MAGLVCASVVAVTVGQVVPALVPSAPTIVAAALMVVALGTILAAGVVVGVGRARRAARAGVVTAATDEGDEAARPPTRRVLAAEWRRLHEPPAVLAVVTDALRGRPVARGVLVALVVVGAVVAWLTTDRWVASAVTAAGPSLVGTVTGWTMRPRTREEFEAPAARESAPHPWTRRGSRDRRSPGRLSGGAPGRPTRR